MKLSDIKEQIEQLAIDLNNKLEKHPNSCSNISCALTNLRFAVENVQGAIDTDTAVGFVEQDEQPKKKNKKEKETEEQTE